MLVMRRKAGERFTIGPDIEIEVLEVNASRVKLGIVAPNSVPIVRKEAQITRQENLSAAQTAGTELMRTLLRKFAGPVPHRQENDGTCRFENF